MTDPRGPERTIVSVDDSRSTATLVMLDCGHTREANQIYTYRIGDRYRCMACRHRGPGKASMYYSIDDQHGNNICGGIQLEHKARETAQEYADDLGAPVYLYSSEPGDEGEIIEPV